MKQFEFSLAKVVEAQRERKISIEQEELRLIPDTNGDTFKVMQNPPGDVRGVRHHCNGK